MSKKDKKKLKPVKASKPGFGEAEGFKKYFPVILFFVLTLVLFSQFVFSDQMLFGTDTVEAGVMFRSFYANFVKDYHQIPMWDPYLFGGMPFVDAMHGDTFYPLALLQFIMPLHKALGWKLVITVFLAGFFTYLCLRAFGFNRGISILGGLAYMFSANLVSWVYGGQDGRMYITSLLPLLFLFLEKGLNTKRYIYYLGLGISIGLLILANHPQLAYYALWALGLYFLFRLIFQFKDSDEESFVPKIKPLLRPVSLFIIAVIIGLALSLIQILPPYIYVNKYSPRAEGARGYEYATSWSSHPEELASQIVPEFCGYNLTDQSTYWGRNPFKQNSDYGGVVPLFLAFLALFLVKDRRIWFFLGISILAIIYSLGAHTPVYRLFYWLVPQVKNFRAPSLIMFLWIFSVVFMASFGVQRVLSGIKSPQEQKKLLTILKAAVIIFGVLAFLFTIGGEFMLSIWNGLLYSDIPAPKKTSMLQNLPNIQKGFWLMFLFISAVAVALYLLVKGKLKTTIFIIWIGALLVIDLWRVNFKFIENFDYFNYFRKNPVVDFLKKDQDRFRAMVLPGTLRGQNFLALYDIPQVFGYHGNQLKRYDEFTEREYREKATSQKEFYNRYSQFLFGPKLDLLNVKYLLSGSDFSHPKFQKAYQSGGLFVFQNTQNLPRARIAFEYEVIQDKEKILERLNDQEFDHKNKIILEKPPQLNLSSADTIEVSGSAEIVDDNINNITIKVKLSHPGFLVLSENFYPAWKAFVDGEETEIHRANYTFRAILLSEGEHQVRFVFDSPIYGLAKNVSGISILFVFFVLILSFVKKPFHRRNLENK
ncbi:MAG: 6-pyruvoyl-tetrahydropterin synthase-related protein [Candidatus Zixiibacteriota bacterium]